MADRQETRLPQLLHDTICQSLSGIHLLARVIERKLRVSAPESADAIGELCILLQGAVKELHEIARERIPTGLAMPDLSSAIEALARRASPIVRCDFLCPRPVQIADECVALAFVRLVGEAIGNAVRHASASKITVTLKTRALRVECVVKDDGCGFAVSRKRKTFSGLDLMELRAKQIGGKIVVRSRVGGGTRVACSTCPLPA